MWLFESRKSIQKRKKLDVAVCLGLFWFGWLVYLFILKYLEETRQNIRCQDMKRSFFFFFFF